MPDQLVPELYVPGQEHVYDCKEQIRLGHARWAKGIQCRNTVAATSIKKWISDFRKGS